MKANPLHCRHRRTLMESCQQCLAPEDWRFDSTGRCRLCTGGNLCTDCQNDNAKRDRQQAATIKSATTALENHEIARIQAQHELESDEGGTAWEKARTIYHERRNTT